MHEPPRIAGHHLRTTYMHIYIERENDDGDGDGEGRKMKKEEEKTNKRAKSVPMLAATAVIKCIHV